MLRIIGMFDSIFKHAKLLLDYAEYLVYYASFTVAHDRLVLAIYLWANT